MKEIKIVFNYDNLRKSVVESGWEYHTFDLFIDGEKQKGVASVSLHVKQEAEGIDKNSQTITIERYIDPLGYVGVRDVFSE